MQRGCFYILIKGKGQNPKNVAYLSFQMLLQKNAKKSQTFLNDKRVI